jgi:hypothetical protein
VHLLFPEHGHLLVAAAAPAGNRPGDGPPLPVSSLARHMAADNGASRAGRVRLPKRWRAGGTHGILACVRYRPI